MQQERTRAGGIPAWRWTASGSRKYINAITHDEAYSLSAAPVIARSAAYRCWRCRGDDLAVLDVLGQFGSGGVGPLVQHAGARRPGDDVAAAAAQYEREADGDQHASDRPHQVHP